MRGVYPTGMEYKVFFGKIGRFKFCLCFLKQTKVSILVLVFVFYVFLINYYCYSIVDRLTVLLYTKLCYSLDEYNFKA